MGTIASQITSLTVVYSTVYSDADQRKHQSSASLAFVWGIHRGLVNSLHKWPVTRKMFPFDDVIMSSITLQTLQSLSWIAVPKCWPRSMANKCELMFSSFVICISVTSIMKHTLSRTTISLEQLLISIWLHNSFDTQIQFLYWHLCDFNLDYEESGKFWKISIPFANHLNQSKPILTGLVICKILVSYTLLTGLVTKTTLPVPTRIFLLQTNCTIKWGACIKQIRPD